MLTKEYKFTDVSIAREDVNKNRAHILRMEMLGVKVEQKLYIGDDETTYIEAMNEENSNICICLLFMEKK